MGIWVEIMAMRALWVYSMCLTLLGSYCSASEVHDLSDLSSDMSHDLHMHHLSTMANTTMAASNASNNSFVTPNPVPPLHPPGSEAPGEDDPHVPRHYNGLGPGIANTSATRRLPIPLNESLAPPQTTTSTAP